MRRQKQRNGDDCWRTCVANIIKVKPEAIDHPSAVNFILETGEITSIEAVFKVFKLGYSIRASINADSYPKNRHYVGIFDVDNSDPEDIEAHAVIMKNGKVVFDPSRSGSYPKEYVGRKPIVIHIPRKIRAKNPR